MQRERFQSVLATIWGGLRRLVSPKLYCFVSYRRDDVPAITSEIRTALKEDLFADAFLDRRSLKAGESWPRKIRAELARSDVVFVVIGPDWEPGRLNDPDDFVHAELVAARRNYSIVAPLLVGIDDLPPMADLPQGLSYLPKQQTGTKLPDDPADENLWNLTINAAGHPAKRARGRKRLVRLCLLGALLVVSVALWFVQRTAEACGTDNLDVGVAIRLDDRRSISDDSNAPRPSTIADGVAEVLQRDLDSSPSVEVSGPQACGRLTEYVESDSPESFATETGHDVLLTGDLTAADQGSELALFLTFDALSIPDAPEVSGTHFVSTVPLGKEISPRIVGEGSRNELGHVAAVLDGTRLYASGRYRDAADRFAGLAAELSGEADASLLRVTELLRANSLLLLARSLRDADPEEVATLHEDAIATYSEVSTLGGVAYGRAYLGIGEVWVERCSAELTADGGEPAASISPDGVAEGMAAFDSAQDAAVLDPATEVEVRLKSSVGRGNLALCGLLLSNEGERRVDLAGQAEQSFQTVVDGAAAVERFDNLASQGNVGLAVVDVVRCDRGAPEAAIELARSHLEAARSGALPLQRADIDQAIELLGIAQTEGVVEPGGQGQLSSSLGVLVRDACGLPPA